MNSIIEKLSLIANQEKVKIDKEALEMIALSAEGGMRDAESLLGQVIALEDKNITLKEVEEIIGATDRKSAAEVAQAILESDSSSAIEKINSLLEDGRDLAVFNKSLVNYLRQIMLLKISPELKSHFSYEITGEQMKDMLSQAEKAELSKIILAISLPLEAQSKIGSAVLPQLPLEIAVIKATGNFPSQEITMKPQKISSISHPTEQTKTILPEKDLKPEKDFSGKIAPELQNAPANLDNTAEIDIDNIKSVWNRLLQEIRPYNHSISVLLTSCQPKEVSGREITIATPYDFYKDKLSDMSNKLTVEQVLGNILGTKIIVKAIVDKNILPKKEAAIAESNGGTQDPLLASAMEILGGKVVEE
jgi:DNA polymerase-3 subunit gamma/tau